MELTALRSPPLGFDPMALAPIDGTPVHFHFAGRVFIRYQGALVPMLRQEHREYGWRHAGWDRGTTVKRTVDTAFRIPASRRSSLQRQRQFEYPVHDSPRWHDAALPAFLQNFIAPRHGKDGTAPDQSLSLTFSKGAKCRGEIDSGLHRH